MFDVPDPKIAARARPQRVAYLLQVGDHEHPWLDSIFSDCFSRYGGRQTLVVPVTDGTISEPYLKWLQALDPDCVFVIADVHSELVSLLMETLSDTRLIAVTHSLQHVVAPRIQWGHQPLSSFSWLPFLKARSNRFQLEPEYVLDAYRAWKDDGFVSDNFGTLQSSFSPIVSPSQLGLKSLLLTPQDAPANRWHMTRGEFDNEISNGYQAIDFMSRSGSVTTLSVLSNLGSQPYRTDHAWNNSFCVVVGDSLLDRISCWNAGLLYGDSFHQAYKTLRVPLNALTTHQAMQWIAEFLANRNHIGQNNSPARVTVRSGSLREKDLSEFIQILEKSGSLTSFESIPSLDACCPATVKSNFFALSSESSTEETPIRGRSTSIDVPFPQQLRYATSSNQIYSQGEWCVDLYIDRLNNNGRFAGQREKWRIPIRSQLVKLFVPNQQARISSDGRLSVFATSNAGPIDIIQPEDETLFRALLTTKAEYLWNDLRTEHRENSTYTYSDISDKGRYLNGTFGLFGSLDIAESTLGNHFWRSTFQSMAVPALSQQDEVIKFLKLRLRVNDGPLVIADDSDWANLAARVIQQSNKLRIPRLTTRYEKLLTAWERELTQAIDLDSDLREQREEVLKEAPNDLRRSLSNLFAKKIFFRGHEWSCRQCSHRNWLGIDRLSEIVFCEVCRQEHSMPADVRLDFKLNEFFAACLREHDTLTVTWALSALRQKAQLCFIFSAQTALYKDYPENQGGKVDRELDVVCIVDGKFILGEAKVNASLITEADMRDLADAVLKCGADIAVLAALVGDQATMTRKLAYLRALLPLSIEIEGIISDWNDSPAAYLV